jgi:CheY-like chemotaxis protein
VSKPRRVLIADDEENFRALAETILSAFGYKTATAADGREAAERIRSFKPDLVIADMNMPYMSGLELLAQTRSTHPHIKFLIATGYGSVETAVEAIKLGAFNYVEKPIMVRDFLMQVRACLRQERALRVFLCHSSYDKAAVRKLFTRLRKDGFDPWLDEKMLLPGQDWQVEIVKAVRNCDIVVVCLSPGSITKEGYVQTEIKIALDVADEKPEGTIFLVPLRLEACAVPDRLKRWQWVDLFKTHGYSRLVGSLRARYDSLASSQEDPLDFLRAQVRKRAS